VIRWLLGSVETVRAIDDTAHRCSELTPTQWSTPTRCRPWDVHALVAHVCPHLSLFDQLENHLLDADAAVTDGAALLRTFNAPGGAAHTMAGDVAQTALSEAVTLPREDAVTRFTECARAARAVALPGRQPIEYPVVGSATLGAVTEVALVEATVHLLDLVDAVGGVGPSTAAIEAARDLLIAVPDPTVAVEVLAGRAATDRAVPVMR
jgi:uncharacterized protein (TIGR03083 family)